MREPPIFLTGMPGSGKTTLGRALAKALGREFFDLDAYIQSRFCSSIADLFAKRGEEGFRRIEHNMLHEVGEMEDVVIACGGGTPCFFDNMDYMLSRGTVLYLEASRERLHERLCRRRAHRPAIANMDNAAIADYINTLQATRLPVYQRAHLTIDSSELEDRESIDRTVNKCILRL
ncbi:MAG: shikimate kinase [Prevotella sp.]|nr:shikimate kinase [Prevotella sp.]MCM1075485.1 shikimate kinase [Ruminococcus sp.]